MLSLWVGLGLTAVPMYGSAPKRSACAHSPSRVVQHEAIGKCCSTTCSTGRSTINQLLYQLLHQLLKQLLIKIAPWFSCCGRRIQQVLDKNDAIRNLRMASFLSYTDSQAQTRVDQRDAIQREE